MREGGGMGEEKGEKLMEECWREAAGRMREGAGRK